MQGIQKFGSTHLMVFCRVWQSSTKFGSAPDPGHNRIKSLWTNFQKGSKVTMMLQTTTIRLISIFLCLGITDAVRGGKSLRRRDDNVPHLVHHQQQEERRAETQTVHKRALKNSRVGDDVQDMFAEPVVEQYYDDPEKAAAAAAAEQAGGGRANTGGKKGNTNEETSLEVDSEVMTDEEEAGLQEPVYDEPTPTPKRSGAGKTSREEGGTSKGVNKGSSTTKGPGATQDIVEPDSEDVYRENVYTEDVYMAPEDDEPETSATEPEPEPEQNAQDEAFPAFQEGKYPIQTETASMCAF